MEAELSQQVPIDSVKEIRPNRQDLPCPNAIETSRKHRASRVSAKTDSTTDHATASFPSLHPVGKMPLEAHKEVGSLLKEVYARTYYCRPVHGLLNVVRGTLEEWGALRYAGLSRDTKERFNMIYWRVPITIPEHVTPVERGEHIGRLCTIREILRTYYSETQLHAILQALNSSIEAVNAWN